MQVSWASESKIQKKTAPMPFAARVLVKHNESSSEVIEAVA